MPGTTIASFILRFVRESSPGASASAWRGIVRHIQTGEEYGFTCIEDAISFIARRVEAAEEAGKPREEESGCV